MTKNSIDLAETYVLHTRAYQDSSLLVECFTRNFGRLTVLARGAKRPKSPFSGLLNPFSRILISYIPKELSILKHAESCHDHLALTGKQLLSGFYLNELITKLLPSHDAATDLFETYHATLRQQCSETSLRHFEKILLDTIGYGISWYTEAQTQEPLKTNTNYYYQPSVGFVTMENLTHAKQQNCFLGKDILAIAEENWHQEGLLSTAKRLMRIALSDILGERKIKTRELF